MAGISPNEKGRAADTAFAGGFMALRLSCGAKLLYVAATRALHELCILHMGDLTGLIADPIPRASVPDDRLHRIDGKLAVM